MAIDWNNIGFPGTRVFEGMAAAANAGQAMSADTMAWMQKRDHRANQPVRDLQRQLAINEMQTELPLAEAANKAILGIQKHAKNMSTTQGFADYMNAENPDQAGGKYKVVKDASGVERIDLVAPDGSLLTSMPGYKGQSALKFAMRNYAMNPARLREKLWDMDFREGDLASRLAMNEQRMDARMQEQLMRMEMMGMKNQMSLMGMMAGKGGKGKGGDDGDQDIRNLTYTLKAQEAADKAAMRELDLRIENGVMVDLEGNPVSKEVRKEYKAKSAAYEQTFLNNFRKGQLPPYALYNAVQSNRPSPMSEIDMPMPQIPTIGHGEIAGGLGVSPFTGAPTLPAAPARSKNSPGFWQRDIYTIGEDINNRFLKPSAQPVFDPFMQ